MHNPLRMATLVTNDLRHGKLHSFPSAEHDGIPLVVIKKASDRVWNSGSSPNIPIPDVQISLLRPYLRKWTVIYHLML